jgi:hexosaminidase
MNMKNCISILLVLFLVRFSNAQKISIIPEPVKIVEKKGVFVLPKIIEISASNIEVETVQFLQSKLTQATGYKAFVNRKGKLPHITLSLNSINDSELGAEGYKLSVSNSSVYIKANQSAGLYYGIQSLLQLLPPQIESKTLVNGVKWTMPSVEITDYPRFGWRGLMLDVSRHFFSKVDVKTYIDNMARYKFNLLHWHLTDDEGWRVEIKSYPNLTVKGAYNAERVGYFNTFAAPPADEPRTYGGFYTQEEIKEIVAYAKTKHIDILPEIDVPGHSLAAVVSYPELSFTPGVEKYQVRSGEELFDWSGPHVKGYLDNTLNPANPKVYSFLDKVFTELGTMFPFGYIHIGGDECPKNYWEKDAAIAELMKKEGLKDMNEVQSYFTKKVVKIVESKGKKAIGWDEILEGGLAPGAAVMSWRGEAGGIEAVKQGHEVVMTPTQYCYIDFMQADSALEAKVYSTLLLKKAYSYEPIAAGMDPKYVKGIQANLWSEQLYNIRYAEYMTWPRGMATAEVAWSPASNKNWESFTNKVEDQFKRLDFTETNYSTAMYDPSVSVSKVANGMPITTLTSQIADLDIHYSWDNSPPDAFYPVYKSPLTVPKGASQLKVITYRGKQKVGRLMTISVENLIKRAK